MLLSHLVRAVGEGVLRERGSREVDPELTEVLLDDGVTTIGPDQIVLATNAGAEADLMKRAASVGCRAVVVAPAVGVHAPAGIAVLESDVAWTQLFVLIRTMLLASHDEAGSDTGPGSVHGLADAVAVMVGGSVVVYDRAHRVVAYSVQGHELDHVRRETILGRRTPDQWVRRFTADRTAYQTYSEPGRVVRVEEYSDLHTRLRIAVHAGNDVVGEISVAEGAEPFASHAEAALRRAARLAVPVMLRHRHAHDAEQLSRERTMRSLLWDGVQLTSALDAALPPGGLFAVGFDLRGDTDSLANLPNHLVTERFVHFLSLHFAGIDQASLVARIDDTYWALVPAPSATPDRLVNSAQRALHQLSSMGAAANAAVAPVAAAPDMLPPARKIVEDLLRAAGASGALGTVSTPETNWAELVLVAARRGLDENGVLPYSPIQVLAEHDAQQDTNFIGTLATFLDAFGSFSAASAQLYLHPNTLRHRMQRISEVSGLDLDDADQRLAAALLVREAREAKQTRETIAGRGAHD
ncbi:PucR family transcriptional regulator [Nocardia callitridis]|uniref:Helix-turn-helix domain-containing protein n=1 Tax=Nocardia callitridis TaxID=648753 RepID=A0ABP9KU62_9NOCA